MCISAFAPDGMTVDFKGTRAAAWVVERSGRYHGLHAMSYQNTVSTANLPPRPNTSHQSFWNQRSGGNNHGATMLLPFPLAPKGQRYLMSAEGMTGFLREMTEMPKPISKGSPMRGGPSFGIDAGAVEVEDYGIYTVLTFKNADSNEISNAIATLPANRRPNVNMKYLESLMNAYNPGPANFALALFCYDPYEAQGKGKQSEPITVVYESAFPDVLFIPGLDQHDSSELPDLRAIVDTDHDLAWSCPGLSSNIADHVRYSKRNPILGEIVPTNVYRSEHNTPMPNGDFFMEIRHLVQGKPLVQRTLPPAPIVAVS